MNIGFSENGITPVSVTDINSASSFKATDTIKCSQKAVDYMREMPKVIKDSEGIGRERKRAKFQENNDEIRDGKSRKHPSSKIRPENSNSKIRIFNYEICDKSKKKDLKVEPYYILDDEQAFNEIFEASSFMGEDYSFRFRTPEEFEAFGPLMTTRVGANLALVAKCYDSDGKLVSVGLGNFSNSEYVPFIINPEINYRRNQNALKSFLDSACLKGRVELLGFGMNDKSQFTLIKQRILDEYCLTSLLSIINPWNIPKKHYESSYFKKFIQEINFSLALGVTKEGNIYIADEPTIDVVGDYSPKTFQNFAQFSEDEFAKRKEANALNC